jgi:hypothetical protein
MAGHRRKFSAISSFRAFQCQCPELIPVRRAVCPRRVAAFVVGVSGAANETSGKMSVLFVDGDRIGRSIGRWWLRGPCPSRARRGHAIPLSISPANSCTNPMTFAESSNRMARSSTGPSWMRIRTRGGSPDCGWCERPEPHCASSRLMRAPVSSSRARQRPVSSFVQVSPLLE